MGSLDPLNLRAFVLVSCILLAHSQINKGDQVDSIQTLKLHGPVYSSEWKGTEWRGRKQKSNGSQKFELKRGNSNGGTRLNKGSKAQGGNPKSQLSIENVKAAIKLKEDNSGANKTQFARDFLTNAIKHRQNQHRRSKGVQNSPSEVSIIAQQLKQNQEEVKFVAEMVIVEESKEGTDEVGKVVTSNEKQKHKHKHKHKHTDKQQALEIKWTKCLQQQREMLLLIQKMLIQFNMEQHFTPIKFQILDVKVTPKVKVIFQELNEMQKKIDHHEFPNKNIVLKLIKTNLRLCKKIFVVLFKTAQIQQNLQEIIQGYDPQHNEVFDENHFKHSKKRQIEKVEAKMNELLGESRGLLNQKQVLKKLAVIQSKCRLIWGHCQTFFGRLEEGPLDKLTIDLLQRFLLQRAVQIRFMNKWLKAVDKQAQHPGDPQSIYNQKSIRDGIQATRLELGAVIHTIISLGSTNASSKSTKKHNIQREAQSEQI